MFCIKNESKKWIANVLGRIHGYDENESQIISLQNAAKTRKKGIFNGQELMQPSLIEWVYYMHNAKPLKPRKKRIVNGRELMRPSLICLI